MGATPQHLRVWVRLFIQNRLETLAAVFAIDVMAYAMMSSHFHLVLRTRPDIVAEWTDEEVARRWWSLFALAHEKRTGADLVLDGSYGCAVFYCFRCGSDDLTAARDL